MSHTLPAGTAHECLPVDILEENRCCSTVKQVQPEGAEQAGHQCEASDLEKSLPYGFAYLSTDFMGLNGFLDLKMQEDPSPKRRRLS